MKQLEPITWAVLGLQATSRSWYLFQCTVVDLLLHVPLVVFNGLVHYRLRRGCTVTWRCLLFMHAMDIAIITGAIAMAGDFDIYLFVAYYVALALVAVVFTSLWLSLVWTSMVALLYSVVSVAVDPGLDLASGEEKALLGRIAAMYGIAGFVSLIARFQRVMRRRSVERERELHRERIELSQAIHDTAAQTAYMVSMGIHRATQLAEDANRELTETLAATASLSRAAMRELKGPSTRGTCLRERSSAACSGRTPTTLPGPHRSPPRCSRPGPSLP